MLAVTPLNVQEFIVDRLNAGVFVVNARMEVVLWNRYMETNSLVPATDVLGRNLFECFPDLPQAWLERKIKNIFIIKNFSFTSWEQRPYLFKFPHNRPVTGGVDCMRQNCTFFPIKGESGNVEYVCVTIFDVTDVSIYQSMLHHALESLAEASNRDGLTGAYNRRFLEETLQREYSRVRRYSGTLSLVMVDLDYFKRINDTHGHLAGDEVLRSVVRNLNGVLREADWVGRYGGEEFAVILPQTDLKGATVVAERLRAAVAAKPVTVGDIILNVTASLGVASWDAELTTHEQLIQRADQALYQSKAGGRNRVTVYSGSPVPSPET